MSCGGEEGRSWVTCREAAARRGGREMSPALAARASTCGGLGRGSTHGLRNARRMVAVMRCGFWFIRRATQLQAEAVPCGLGTGRSTMRSLACSYTGTCPACGGGRGRRPECACGGGESIIGEACLSVCECGGGGAWWGWGWVGGGEGQRPGSPAGQRATVAGTPPSKGRRGACGGRPCCGTFRMACSLQVERPHLEQSGCRQAVPGGGWGGQGSAPAAEPPTA